MGLGPRLNQNKSDNSGPAPPMRIENRIGIQAPSEIIWEILADVERWPEWNPIYPKAVGSLRIGARLELTLALPGESHREIEPKVIDWVPNEQILWTDITWAGWVKTTRFIEIDEIDRGACIFINGELFVGLVARYYGKKNRRTLKLAFAAMSEAVKIGAEALWRERQASAT